MPQPFAHLRPRDRRPAAAGDPGGPPRPRLPRPAAFGALLCLFFSGARPAASADWPMFLLNPEHVAISPEVLSAPMALEWRFHTSYYQNNPVAPVVVGKTLYLASQSSVYALDAESGERKWVYPAEGPIGTPAPATIKATPVVSDGTLFVAASDGTLYAVDAEQGILKWQYQAGGNIRFSPIIVDGVVYFGSDDHRVYGIDSKTGEPAMEPVKAGNGIIGSPAYADGILYFSSADLTFYAYNIATRRLKFTMRTLNANVYTSPVATDRYIYTVGGNRINCLLRNGAIRWAFEARSPITSTPLVTPDAIYFGDRSGNFYALDLRGREFWKIADNATRVMRFSERATRPAATEEPFLRLGGAVFSSPILSGENIYVGTNRGFLYAIDAATGRVKWEYGIFSNLPANTYPNIAAPPVISNGRLYVMSDDGALHCFAPDAADIAGPTISNVVPVRATEMNGTPPILMGAVVSDEGSGVDAASIKMTLDGTPVETSYQPNSGWVYYRTPVTQPIQPMESGRHTVELTVADWKGNVSRASWSFTIDNTLATSITYAPATGSDG